MLACFISMWAISFLSYFLGFSIFSHARHGGKSTLESEICRMFLFFGGNISAEKMYFWYSTSAEKWRQTEEFFEHEKKIAIKSLESRPQKTAISLQLLDSSSSFKNAI